MLLPEDKDLPQHYPTSSEASLEAFRAYDLPSVQALVPYFHAAVGFPVRNTWLKAIKAGNYESWMGLTYNNAAMYCPSANETLRGHMVQTRQDVRSTKPKPKPATSKVSAQPVPDPVLTDEKSNEFHIRVPHCSKLYTDDTGRFLIHSRSGNQYAMIAYHYNSNSII